MASASKIILALLFLFLIGIVWAAFYNVIYVQQPAANPYVIATDGGTWNIILWLWGLSAVIIGLGIGIGLLSDGNINPIIQINAAYFCVNLLLVILWINMWVPMNVLIPGSLHEDANIVAYDNFFLFIMFGMDMLALICGGTVRVFSSSGRAPKPRYSRSKPQIIIKEFRNPKYESKFTYPSRKRTEQSVPNEGAISIKKL